LRRVLSAASVVTTLIAVGAPAAVAGDDPGAKKRKVDAQVKVLRAQVAAGAAQVVAATDALETANVKLGVAQQRLVVARQTLVGARAAAAVAAERLASTQVESVRAAMTYDHVAEDLQAHRAAAGQLARQIYLNGGLARLGLVLGARNPRDLVSALAYAGAVSRSEHGTLETLTAEQHSLAAQQARLAADREQLATDSTAADAAVTRSTRAAADADDADGEVESLVVLRGKALADAEKLKAAIEEEFKQEEAESSRLAELIAERAAAARRAHRGSLLPLGDGILSLPVFGPITSPFGMRYHPILHRWKLHTGTDFGVPVGTAIRAAADGVVLDAFRNSAYGNRVIVDHGLVNGVYLVTTYNHLSRWVVHSGQQVKRGQVIAYSGNTGWTTGPHLHFEVLVDGRFVNPLTWLRALKTAS
jgi:murein DD-endopeptidase MepM/ murein hydrolase activator NlpD